MLYLGCDVPTVTREFERLAAKQGRTVDEFLPRDMFTYELRLQRLLDLRVSEHADAVGLTPADFADDDLSRCQLIGRTADAAGFEGLIAPSATGEGEVVAVFLGRTLPGSVVRDVDSERWVAPPA